jgi:anti-sigma regulatory factor (Ser/Thr protein kinase)
MTAGSMPLELDVGLPRTLAAAGAARRHVSGAFGRVLPPERFADLQLAVTELVANAIAHGTGDIRLRLRVEGRRLYGEVIDDGGGFEHAIRERSPSDVTGRGLGIVAALADEWGIHEGSTHVWFALDVSVPVRGTTDPKLGGQRRPDALA